MSESSRASHSPVSKRCGLACQACRALKAKCEIANGQRSCYRCLSSSIPCTFLPSRRGRVKGSKNIRTLERDSQRPGSTSPLFSSADVLLNTDLQPPFPQFPSSETPPTPQQMLPPPDPHEDRFEAEQWDHPRRLTLQPFSITDDGPISAPEHDHLDENETPRPSIAQLAKHGWSVDDPERRFDAQDTIPTAMKNDLPPDDAALLERWSSDSMRRIIREQTRYVDYAAYSTKRDVGSGLDPVQQLVVSNHRAEELFTAYFQYVNPQWPILDPSLHTLTYVQTHSALLMSAILAVGSTALASLPDSAAEQDSEALALHTHVEKVNLVVYMTGAQSIEIIQAHIILSRYGASYRSQQGEQKRMRAAMLPVMGAAIGLDRIRRPSGPLRSNDLRTRALLVINEQRFREWYGRQTADMSGFELDNAEIEDFARCGPQDPFSALPAMYLLVYFNRSMQARIETACRGPLAHTAIEQEVSCIEIFIDNWISDWCSAIAGQQKVWHLIQEALSLKLLLLAQIRFPGSSPSPRPRYKQLLVDTAVRMFEEALKTLTTPHMTHRASILTFAASLVIRFTNRRDLVLRLALRLAGDVHRPSVPTTRRDAGRQMLALLFANQQIELPQGTGDLVMDDQPDDTQASQHRQLPQSLEALIASLYQAPDVLKTDDSRPVELWPEEPFSMDSLLNPTFEGTSGLDAMSDGRQGTTLAQFVPPTVLPQWDPSVIQANDQPFTGDKPFWMGNIDL